MNEWLWIGDLPFTINHFFNLQLSNVHNFLLYLCFSYLGMTFSLTNQWSELILTKFYFPFILYPIIPPSKFIIQFAECNGWSVCSGYANYFYWFIFICFVCLYSVFKEECDIVNLTHHTQCLACYCYVLCRCMIW